MLSSLIRKAAVKRCALIIIILLFTVILAACAENSQSAVEEQPESGVLTVPEARVGIEVKRNAMFYRDSVSWSFTSEHHPDPESRTDQVDILLTVEYPYGGYTEQKSIVFRYNQASDLWSVDSESSWKNKEPWWKPDEFIGTWTGQYTRRDSDPRNYRFVIRSVDFEEGFVDGEYSVEYYDMSWEGIHQVWNLINLEKTGSLPIIHNSSSFNYFVGIYYNGHNTRLYDFALTPEHGVQFREDDKISATDAVKTN